MKNTKLANAIKATRNKPIENTYEGKTEREKKYARALRLLGLSSIAELSMRDLDRVYLDYKRAYKNEVIDLEIFSDICNSMLGFGIDKVLKRCHYGKDILAVADGLEL